MAGKGRAPAAGSQLRLWTNEDLRDAIMALYRSEVLPKEIPKRFNGVSRQTVEAKVKQLKPFCQEKRRRVRMPGGECH